MKVAGIDGLTVHQIRDEVRRGGRFVVYGWCVSFVVLTLKRSSDITFVRAGESRVVAGLGWTLLTFFLGWWGLPWGLISTPMVLVQNLGGGTDVTADVMRALDAELGPAAFSAAAPGATAPVMPLALSPSSGPSSRDLGALVMSVLSLGCCAPLGWIGAVLAILSLRDARAVGRPTPVVPIITLVLAGLSSFVFAAGTVAYVTGSRETKARQRAALARAAPGRVLATLDQPTACALAEAGLRDGLVEFRTLYDAVECDRELVGDAQEPRLGVVGTHDGKAERFTTCFARSSRRWYVLALHAGSGCPDAPVLDLDAHASEADLEAAERRARRDVQDAPMLVTAQPPPAPHEQVRLALVVTNVATKQRATDAAPFHAPGGAWTFFDLAPADAPTATLRVGLKVATESPRSFSELRLVPLDRARGRSFVEAFARAFHVAAPAPAAKAGALSPVTLTAAVLGEGLVRGAGGDGFTSPADPASPGSWTATKVFLEKDERAAEVFFNVDLEAGDAELVEKDEADREELAALLERALVDGW